MAKDEDYVRMIHTARWQRLRRSVLTEHPLCQRCEEEGRVTAATEVHHIVPVETAPGAARKESLMFDRANLKALCRTCHAKTHAELGRGGKKSNRERKDAQLQWVIGKFS